MSMALCKKVELNRPGPRYEYICVYGYGCEVHRLFHTAIIPISSKKHHRPYPPHRPSNHARLSEHCTSFFPPIQQSLSADTKTDAHGRLTFRFLSRRRRRTTRAHGIHPAPVRERAHIVRHLRLRAHIPAAAIIRRRATGRAQQAARTRRGGEGAGCGDWGWWVGGCC